MRRPASGRARAPIASTQSASLDPGPAPDPSVLPQWLRLDPGSSPLTASLLPPSLPSCLHPVLRDLAKAKLHPVATVGTLHGLRDKGRLPAGRSRPSSRQPRPVPAHSPSATGRAPPSVVSAWPVSDQVRPSPGTLAPMSPSAVPEPEPLCHCGTHLARPLALQAPPALSGSVGPRKTLLCIYQFIANCSYPPTREEVTQKSGTSPELRRVPGIY